MKPLFTIHGGEYIFGNKLEKRCPQVHIWIPSKDDGIDFLLTDSENMNPLSIQVKYSRDFNWSHGNIAWKEQTKSSGWYSFNRIKLQKSKADYWVLVNYDGVRRDADFVFMKPSELLAHLDALDRKGERIECYILVTHDNKCFETRNLRTKEAHSLLDGGLDNSQRDFTPHLERWDIIENHFSIM